MVLHALIIYIKCTDLWILSDIGLDIEILYFTFFRINSKLLRKNKKLFPSLCLQNPRKRPVSSRKFSVIKMQLHPHI